MRVADCTYGRIDGTVSPYMAWECMQKIIEVLVRWLDQIQDSTTGRWTSKITIISPSIENDLDVNGLSLDMIYII